MERRPPQSVRYRTPRHAHAGKRRHVWIGATVLALTSLAMLAAISMGAVAGAGVPASTATTGFQAIDVAAAVSSSSSGPIPVASDVAAPAGSLAIVLPSRECSTPGSRVPSNGPVLGAPRSGGTGPARASTPKTRPVAAFLGDSYTTGYNGAGLGRAGWPAIVAASLKLRPQVHAVAGTGFVNQGWTGQPTRTRVTSVINAHPQIVFLAAGHNDRRYATARSTKAADAVIDRLHKALPDSVLVVIGPIWQDGNTPRSLRLLRDHLRRKAAAIGAVFVDPLRAGWFAGAAHRLIGPDGIHPTNGGHRHIARLVLRALHAAPRLATTPDAHPTSPGPPGVKTAAVSEGLLPLPSCSP